MNMQGNLKKMTNKELIQSALNSIEKLGSHVVDINTGNTYFMFTGSDDSICHFHIKEIPGFLFAFWTIDRYDTLKTQQKNNTILWCDSLNIDTKSELIFFTQYERDLDKFKPSRSGFVMGIYRQSWEEENDNGDIVNVEDWSNFYEIESILKFMKKHRIRSVEYAGCQTRYIWEDDRSSFNLFIKFISGWCYEYKYRFKKWYKYKKAIRVSKRYMRKLKTFNYIIRDEGNCVSPRIDIAVRRKDNITSIELYEKDWDIIEKFDNKFGNIVSINWRQYGGDDAESIEKDKHERDWFYWFCDYWINGKYDGIFDDVKVLEYSVEKVDDLDEIIERENRKRFKEEEEEK